MYCSRFCTDHALCQSGCRLEGLRAAQLPGRLELLLSNFCSAMSPAPDAAQAPASISLFDLSADAPILQGLSLAQGREKAQK